jgi:hypothetical protein
MNADEPITVEYLRKRSIEAQANRIIEGVLKETDNGELSYFTYVNLLIHETILELLKKKFPDCKITFEHRSEHPGLMFPDETFTKFIHPPRKCKITIDWSATN